MSGGKETAKCDEGGAGFKGRHLSTDLDIVNQFQMVVLDNINVLIFVA